MQFIDPEKVYMGKNNPRTKVDGSSIMINARERREAGKRPIVVPIIVKKYEGELEGFEYEIIDGQRRLQSALGLRLKSIPFVLEEELNKDLEQELAAYDANENREDIPWFDRAKFYTRLNEVYGLTQVEIGKRVGLSKQMVNEYVNVYKKSQRVRSTVLLPLELVKEVVNKCPEQDIRALFIYIQEYKVPLHDLRKILFALKNYYARLFIIGEFNKELEKELREKYHLYRFDIKGLKLFDVESKLRMGELPLTVRVINKTDCPTEADAKAYAKKYHGEFIREVVIDGWEVGVMTTNQQEIDEKLGELKPFITMEDVKGVKQ